MNKRQHSIEVGKPAAPNEGAPRRHVKAAAGEWHTPIGRPHVTTAYELFKDGCREFRHRRCMGQRQFIAKHSNVREVQKRIRGEIVTEKKDWTTFELGPYSFITFGELETLVTNLASGLLALGVKPRTDVFCIYCRTSCEWLQMALALWSQSITLATAYDSLGIQGLERAISETGASAILVDPSLLHVLANGTFSSIRVVSYRETDGELAENEKSDIRRIENNGGVVIPFSKLIELGRRRPQEPCPPTPSTRGCIMYTSGSTGAPKGVILNHSNLISGTTGATGSISRAHMGPRDVFLGVLPLAHIFELNVEMTMFHFGFSIGYGRFVTLTDMNMKNCNGDMRELRPTLMCGVPALWELLKKGILMSLKEQPPRTQKIFWKLFNGLSKLHSWGLAFPIVDSFVFRKVRVVTGGRLRYGLNGGASLARDTRVFLAIVLAPILMGYGLTESNAQCTTMDPRHLEHDTSGELVPCVTVKLVDFPEAGYFAHKNQGEIYIRGPCVSPGYLNHPEETKENYTADGWFRTGDIGEWSPNGCLTIIDRCKNLAKTSNGEYVAPERLEAFYKSNDYVKNICIVADEKFPKPIALMLPFEPAVENLCRELGRPFSSDVYSDQDVYLRILESIQQTGRHYGLASFEVIPAVCISPIEWTAENGLLSPVGKLQRRALRTHFAGDIKVAFDTSGQKRSKIALPVTPTQLSLRPTATTASGHGNAKSSTKKLASRISSSFSLSKFKRGDSSSVETVEGSPHPKFITEADLARTTSRTTTSHERFLIDDIINTTGSLGESSSSHTQTSSASSPSDISRTPNPAISSPGSKTPSSRFESTSGRSKRDGVILDNNALALSPSAKTENATEEFVDAGVPSTPIDVVPNGVSELEKPTEEATTVTEATSRSLEPKNSMYPTLNGGGTKKTSAPPDTQLSVDTDGKPVVQNGSPANDQPSVSVAQSVKIRNMSGATVLRMYNSPSKTELTHEP